MTGLVLRRAVPQVGLLSYGQVQTVDEDFVVIVLREDVQNLLFSGEDKALLVWERQREIGNNLV